MAKPTKRRIEAGSTGSSRTTPKGGSSRTTPKGGGEVTSKRYTPPTSAAAHMPSPPWVPVLMFAFFGLGILMIFLNYTEILPGSPSGWWLLGGLGGILAGIITATQLH